MSPPHPRHSPRRRNRKVVGVASVADTGRASCNSPDRVLAAQAEEIELRPWAIAHPQANVVFDATFSIAEAKARIASSMGLPPAVNVECVLHRRGLR